MDNVKIVSPFERVKDPGEAVAVLKELIEGCLKGGAFKSMDHYERFKSAFDLLNDMVQKHSAHGQQ